MENLGIPRLFPLHAWGGSPAFTEFGKRTAFPFARMGRLVDDFAPVQNETFSLCTHGAVTFPPATTRVTRFLRIQVYFGG